MSEYTDAKVRTELRRLLTEAVYGATVSVSLVAQAVTEQDDDRARRTWQVVDDLFSHDRHAALMALGEWGSAKMRKHSEARR